MRQGEGEEGTPSRLPALLDAAQQPDGCGEILLSGAVRLQGTLQ